MGASSLPPPRVPEPGDIVDGKYRILRLLGAGGMGTVLAAEHLRLRQQVAIKFLNPAMLGVAQVVERFDREARASATLRSAHVVRVTDVAHTPEGVPYMVMELLQGVDLESERQRRGRLPYSEVVDYVLQACGALAEAHDAGIIHRDLKPANLFLAHDEAAGKVMVKVLDFGISKFLKGEDAKLTSAGTVIGTTLYMSPEQIKGASTADARSDIWSLGVILYELLSGEAPWTGSPMRVAVAISSEDAPDIRSSVALPEPIAALIHRMLSKSPEQRPQSVQELVSALTPFAPPDSVGAEVANRIERRSQRDTTGPTAPDSRPNVVESDRLRLIVSSTATPDRSTMAATTHSAVTELAPPPARPRWPIFAFGGATVAALVAIATAVVALRNGPTPASSVGKELPPSVSVDAGEPVAAPVAKVAAPEVTASSSSSVSAGVASAAPPPPATTTARGKKPPAPATTSAAKAPPPSPPPAPKNDGKAPLFLP